MGVRSPSRPFSLGQPSLPIGIVDVFNAYGRGGAHAELFAVVHLRRSASGELEGGHEFGDFVVMGAVSVAVPLARLVVVGEKVFGLSVGGVVLDLIE